MLFSQQCAGVAATSLSFLILTAAVTAQPCTPPTCPAPADRSCAGTVQWHPGVQLHDIHPAGDIANRGDLTTKEECASWCCDTDRCVAFYFTSNQSVATTQGCSAGSNCCWIKPTFNASRTNDSSVCHPASVCHSGVLRRGLPSPLPPSVTPPSTLDLVMLNDPEARCLDGTQGAYYLARGVGTGANKWVFVQEGKAWCLSPDDCYSRAKATDGKEREVL